MWAVFAGPAWPADQDSPETHLVGLFPTLMTALQAFGHVAFRPLPLRSGRSRWRGSAPFGATIVQIERLTSHDLLLTYRPQGDSGRSAVAS
jgi:hypothetical protein